MKNRISVSKSAVQFLLIFTVLFAVWTHIKLPAFKVYAEDAWESCPAVEIAGDDGHTFYYVNYHGETLYRPYVSQQNWTNDGEKFICLSDDQTNEQSGDKTYKIHIYDTKTQRIKYLDTTNFYTNCLMGADDRVYYLKYEYDIEQKAKVYSFYSISALTDEKARKLYTFPKGIMPSMPHLTLDCKYASFEIKDFGYYYERPKNTTVIFRVDLESGEYDYTYYAFGESNIVNHVQINPKYPNIMFFSHDALPGNSDFSFQNLLDRSNIIDLSSNELFHIIQGAQPELDENGKETHMIFLTHETWSRDGNYLYITNISGDGTPDTPPNGVVRVNKDGSHRQIYYNDDIRKYGSNHSFASSDGRYLALDDKGVYLMSAETNQVFPLCSTPFAVKGHPYHPHVVIAPGKYIVNWGMVIDDVLGISWFDFSNFDDTELAEGGRYPFNKYVTNVRYTEQRKDYAELSCDSTVTIKDGVECLYALNGKGIYLDVDESIADAVNVPVKITFDYYDNTYFPIILTYTKGVENDNDLCRFENMSKKIMRNNSKTWKTAEVIIESGNFENAGTFSTDFNIKGETSKVYISNIRVENLSNQQVCADFSSISEENGQYLFTGSLSRNSAAVKGGMVIAAVFNDSDNLIDFKNQSVVFDGSSKVKFCIKIPITEMDKKIKFFVWNGFDILAPISDVISVSNSIELSATEEYNGVKLNWKAVDGIDRYEIYKDGVRIATSEQLSYDDKYFDTAVQLEHDYMNEYTTEHSYHIVAGNYVSKTVKACAKP